MPIAQKTVKSTICCSKLAFFFANYSHPQIELLQTDIMRARLFRWAAPERDRFNFYRHHIIAARQGQNIARMDKMATAFNAVAIDPDMPFINPVLRQAAAFAEPQMPEQLIDPQANFGQALLLSRFWRMQPL
jgi:hypothetical protein